MGTPTDQQSLAHKELVFLQHKRRVVRCLRDDLWRWGIGEVKKAAEQREWGAFPHEVSRALVECRRNRTDTRLHVPRLWDLWPLPLQQLEQDWDEVYVDDFPEVSDSFARPGDPRWDTLYTVFTKHCLTHSSSYTQTVLGLPDISAAASRLPVCLHPAEKLEFAIRALGGGISREPSLERHLLRKTRTPAEALGAPHPEPVRRKARTRKLSRRHVPSPILQGPFEFAIPALVFGNSAARLSARVGAVSCWDEALQLCVALHLQLFADFGAPFSVVFDGG